MGQLDPDLLLWVVVFIVVVLFFLCLPYPPKGGDG
jgi:hypothetical protein